MQNSRRLISDIIYKMKFKEDLGLDSIELKNFGRNSRLELNSLIKKSEYSRSRDNQMDIQIYLKILIVKYLEENNYIDRVFYFHGDFKTRFLNSLEKLSNLWKFIFQSELLINWELIVDKLLESKFIAEMVSGKSIDGSYWKEVEIIGWLYQYYIADVNDCIIRNKKKYSKKEIPYVTQVFTPKWIVAYLTENTLGRFYMETNNNYELLDKFSYYLDGERPKWKGGKISVREIKCFDPALGSGNVLLYLFDFLYVLYEREGCKREEIPLNILKYNLFGLELDSSAYSIASFALLAKASKYDREFFKKLKNMKDFKLNIACIEELSEGEIRGLSEILPDEDLRGFVKSFKNSKIYGSLTRLGSFEVDLESRLIAATSGTEFENRVERLILQYKIMRERYHITITNPPYMGVRSLNTKLRKYLEKHFELGKYDLYSAFILYCMEMTYDFGQIGLMTPYTWMFIKSYEGLRKYIIENKNISSLVQMEYSAFSYATVPICIFTLKNYPEDLRGDYIKLSDFKGVSRQEEKVLKAVKNSGVKYRYSCNTENYKNLPDFKIAYWVDKRVYEIYKNSKLLSNISRPRQGIATGNNKKYISLWHQVDYEKIGFKEKNTENFHKSKKIYAPYNKGGHYRKWYGNFDYVVKFDEESYEALKNSGNKLPNKKFYFKEGLSWSFVSSSYFGIRYTGPGSVFDVGGSTVFLGQENIYYILGFLCSKLASYFMDILNPTLNHQVGDMKNLPVIIDGGSHNYISSLVLEAIKLSKLDWDSFESSWDYRRHPIMYNLGGTLEEGFKLWIQELNLRFGRLKLIEEKINKRFIEIYKFEDILDETVLNRDITISRVTNGDLGSREKNRYTMNEREAMESFLSYFIGLSLGRYSLDGKLVTSLELYKNTHYNSYKPVRTINYSKIYLGLREFVTLIYGGKNLEENLSFIFKLMGWKSIDDLEGYFRDEFQDYHKRLYAGIGVYKFKKKGITYL